MNRLDFLLVCACACLTSCGNDSSPRSRPEESQDTAGAPALAASALLPSTRETSPDGADSTSYIRRLFLSQIGELPRLGWITNSGQFLAAERIRSITIYGPTGSSTSATFHNIISGEAQREVRQKEWLACEHPDTGLAAYSFTHASNLGRQRRALFTARAFPNYTSTEMSKRPLTADEKARSSSVLNWPAGAPTRSEVVAIPGDSNYYSIHGLFGQDSALTKEALLLHRRDGTVIAYELQGYENTELCDGCGLPTYKDYVAFAYNVENVLRLDGFVYPVLLIDTGTIEGRALSLVTFTPTRHVSEFRVYEYVVNCGSVATE